MTTQRFEIATEAETFEAEVTFPRPEMVRVYRADTDQWGYYRADTSEKALRAFCEDMGKPLTAFVLVI